MNKCDFLTIFASYGNLDVVQTTLPSVIDETLRNDAQLIVHDSTELRHGQEEKWLYLRELEKQYGFFLLLSTNLSMAHARNMCLRLGQEQCLPEFIAIMEDDHGYRTDFIRKLVEAMETYYGRFAPNGLRFGLFSGCRKHCWLDGALIPGTRHRYVPVSSSAKPMFMGGINNCFRAAPTYHWDHVLKGYDTDEYLISTHQTANINMRNYHKGFTAMVVEDGSYMFDVERQGRGWSDGKKSGLWDDEYTASDPRSKFKRE